MRLNITIGPGIAGENKPDDWQTFNRTVDQAGWIGTGMTAELPDGGDRGEVGRGGNEICGPDSCVDGGNQCDGMKGKKR